MKAARWDVRKKTCWDLFVALLRNWLGQHFFSMLKKFFCILYGCFSSSSGISRVNTVAQTYTWAVHNDVLLMKEAMRWLSRTCKVTFLCGQEENWEFMNVNISANEGSWKQVSWWKTWICQFCQKSSASNVLEAEGHGAKSCNFFFLKQTQRILSLDLGLGIYIHFGDMNSALPHP